MQDLDPKALKSLLQQTTKKIESAKNNIEINTLVEHLITSLIGSEYASLWIFDETKALLFRERSQEHVREISMLEQKGIIAKSFLTVSGGIYNYLASEKEYFPASDNPDDIRMKSKIIAPILDGERFLGMVTAYSSIRQIKNFTEDDMEILNSIAQFLSNVIYYMHPEIKEEKTERIYLDETLKNGSQQLIAEVGKVHDAQQHPESTDETLNFLATTVHDIRTPANSMYGFLELLEEQLDNPRLLQYVRNAKESAHFINELTTSILDRLSSQHERAHSKPVAFNPSKFFADIADNFSANMYNKSLDFNIYIDPLLPKEIVIDRTVLKRVIMNLIGNAYKFTPTKQMVEFSVDYISEHKKMQISVKDTGIGIAPEKQKEIFEAFKQAEENTASEFGGTGLGLAISAEYVKQLGGELKLTSALDKGSTFYFEIPLDVSDAQPNFPRLKHASSKYTILLKSHNIVSSHNILRYMSRMGIADSDISIVNTHNEIPKETTHLICFQSTVDKVLIKLSLKKGIKLLVVEEQLFSLISKENSDYNVISKDAYYADTLYDCIRNSSRIKVLVVDDDRINIELIKAVLEDDFYHVDVAYNGETALSLLQNSVQTEDPFNLVYLDENMPGLSGTQTIQEFRAYEKKYTSEPIIAVSISGDPLRDTGKTSPFDFFVGKPFKKREIKEVLEHLKKS